MVLEAVPHLVAVQKAVHLVAVQKAVPHLEVAQRVELYFHHYQLEVLHLEVVLHYQEAVHSHHPLEVVLVHCSKVDTLVQLDYLHNFLRLAVDQEVYPHQENYLLHQVVVHSHHPLEAVLDLLVHHSEDTRAHKGCYHNLGFVLFHLEEEGQLVNM